MDAMTDFDALEAFVRARLADDEDDPGGWSAARVLAEVDAKRRMLDLALGERHTTVEDGWYSCGAATEERDGGECYDEGRVGTCDCGRDRKVERMLCLLALPYAGHPAYRSEWAPEGTRS
jgi:hypothetical protein